MGQDRAGQGLNVIGERVVATVLYLSDVHSLGLKVAQGLQFTEAFYWDLNDGTREWAKRFAPRNNNRYPTAMQARIHSAAARRACSALLLKERIGTLRELAGLPPETAPTSS